MRHVVLAPALLVFVPLALSGPVLARSPHLPVVVVPGGEHTMMHGRDGDPYKGFTTTGHAVRQTLHRLATACGHAVTGTGYAVFTPGIAGKMHGPHMILRVGLTGSHSTMRWALETVMSQGNAVRDDSPVGDLAVNNQGDGTLTERTMPMIHPGTYMVQLLVRDLSCQAGTRSPVAYKTTPARIAFKGMMMSM